MVLEEDQKFFKLLELLGVYQEQGSVLVFVDKQEHADELMKNLLKHSYPCMPLHGGIDQYDRDSTIEDYKAGNIKLLVRSRSWVIYSFMDNIYIALLRDVDWVPFDVNPFITGQGLYMVEIYVIHVLIGRILAPVCCNVK